MTALPACAAVAATSRPDEASAHDGDALRAWTGACAQGVGVVAGFQGEGLSLARGAGTGDLARGAAGGDDQMSRKHSVLPLAVRDWSLADGVIAVLDTLIQAQVDVLVRIERSRAETAGGRPATRP